MTILYRSKLKSHPDRLLADHITGVHQTALLLFDKTPCNFLLFSNEELRKVISAASWFHDFGKATPYFQEYIQNPDKSSTEDERKKRRHGLISALMTFGVLKDKMPENIVLAIFGFIIVRRHHGNLENFTSLITFVDGDLENCRFQSQQLNYDDFHEMASGTGYEKFTNKEFLQNTIEFFEPRTPRLIKRLNRAFTTEHYFVLNLLYSLLLQSDKTDAILTGASVNEPGMLMSKDIHSYKTRFRADKNNTINMVRNQAFNSAEDSIKVLKQDQRILSINIPTGAGKTITSLNAALKLCERYNHTHVIYCLPFTSVIDQNFEVFNDIREASNLPDDSGILLRHHHLTDIHYQTKPSDFEAGKIEDQVYKEYIPNQALHLIEGWESRITMTTFVQFIYSLISYKNACLRKFHRLSNAVIILDEVQTVPHPYWRLIREMLTNMVTLMNSRVILVTATMPLIFSENNGEIIELVPEKRDMFNRLSRIELDVTRIAEGKMDWQTFCREATDLVQNNPQKDILLIMNTVRAARELYQVFSEIAIPHRLEFLSSQVIPKDRLRRISDIQNKDRKEHVVVISTQLVEAGVDIDLDIVIRDFAPLDSIFQTCGRCNRESRYGVKGQVILYYISDSNGWTPSTIYNRFLLQKTEKVLKDYSIISENDFFHLAQEYFNEVHQFGSQQESDTILNRIKELKYHD